AKATALQQHVRGHQARGARSQTKGRGVVARAEQDARVRGGAAAQPVDVRELAHVSLRLARPPGANALRLAVLCRLYRRWPLVFSPGGWIRSSSRAHVR